MRTTIAFALTGIAVALCFTAVVLSSSVLMVPAVLAVVAALATAMPDRDDDMTEIDAWDAFRAGSAKGHAPTNPRDPWRHG